MFVVTLALVVALGIVAAVLLLLRRANTRRSVGWRLLAHAGWPLVLAGAIFVARFWTPTPGPYVANVRYPFGSHLNAWAVSFGFTWIAFGLLFTAFVVLVPAAVDDARGRRVAWLVLLAAWVLCWLPHGIIGLAVAIGGMTTESTASYGSWARAPLGALVLLADALLLLTHFGCSIGGFALAGREVWRTHAARRPVIAAGA